MIDVEWSLMCKSLGVFPEGLQIGQVLVVLSAGEGVEAVAEGVIEP